MDGPGAADRGVPAQGQDPAPGSPSYNLGHPLAASERRQVAGHPRGPGALVAGGSDVHPLGPPGRVGAAAASGPGARGPTRDDGSRWHQHPGSPQGGGRGKKGVDSQERDEREALGRSRGGYGTKACVIADGLGRAVAFILVPGQAHELPMGPGLLDGLPDVPGWVVGDRGLASNPFRDRIWDLGARPAIPPKRTDAPVACPPWIYANRHLVENLWARPQYTTFFGKRLTGP